MGHGAPDFGAYAVKETIASLADMADLAVRLGSIVEYDRKGDVLWLDNFESGIAGWKPTLEGLGASVDISSLRARSPGFSCLLTAGSNGDHLASIMHYSAVIPLSTVGSEFSFAFEDEFDHFLLEKLIYDGTHRWNALIKYDRVAAKLLYYDADWEPHDLITGIVISYNDYLFYTLKMVVDPLTDTYKRVMLNNITIDLTGAPMQKIESPATPYISDTIYLVGTEGENDKMYVDDVILTRNEP